LFHRANSVLREEFEQKSKILKPQFVTSGFELALIGAVQEYWPEAKRQ